MALMKDARADRDDPVFRLDRAAAILFAAVLALLGTGAVVAVVSPQISLAQPPAAMPAHFRDLAQAEAPIRLVIDSLQINAPIFPISEQLGGTLTPPVDAQDVGWWSASARPGSRTGQTIITGHTVHTGGGQLDHLGAIQPGAIIKVVTPGGTVWYRETAVLVYTKSQVAAHAQELFAQDARPNRLELVTCTGWTGSYYTSNVFVFAQPLGVPANTTTT